MKPHPYRLFLGFMIIVLIWSTTPLAIKWSSEGPSFIFGVFARMTIGMSMLLLIAWVKRVPIPWHRQAVLTYLAAGAGIYGSMTAVYWGAQFIQSGFISVLFGLTPILTGILAYFLLEERNWTLGKIGGVLLGLIGLLVIFSHNIDFGSNAVIGIAAVVIGVSLHAFSAVAVKKVHGDLSSLTVTTGGMLLAMPAYIVTWFLLDGQWPASISTHALWSIVYLGVIATTIGFNLYFYVLKHMGVNQISLLTLITPVMALWIGQLFNHEQISTEAWLGSALILFGMSFYQWSPLLVPVWLRRRK